MFEDDRIYRRLRPTLYEAADWVPLRRCAAAEAVRRDAALLPFVAIPLVYFTREPQRCRETSLADWQGLAFGGINNSAVKTLVKAVWSRHGRAAAVRLLEENLVTDMPIGAFQAVRTGAAQTALVPSLYALRADGEQTFLELPQEGPVLIPSYFAARRSIPEAVARRVAERLLSAEFCDFYTTQGDLIALPEAASGRSRQERDRCFAPDAAFLAGLTGPVFYRLYCDCLDTARDGGAAD